MRYIIFFWNRQEARQEIVRLVFRSQGSAFIYATEKDLNSWHIVQFQEA